jgi:trimethylamine--corrinoid protein Co-methyltransferase
MDADQLGTLHHLAQGVMMDDNGQAMDALREVGPGGHFLGCEHTQQNFKSAFWRSDLFDYKPFETWYEEGARDTETLAANRVAKMIGDYQAPALDEGTRDAIDDYVARKKASMPDAFI